MALFAAGLFSGLDGPYFFEFVEKWRNFICQLCEAQLRPCVTSATSKCYGIGSSTTFLQSVQNTSSVLFFHRKLLYIQKLTIETFMNGIRPVVTEKEQFESGDESILIAHFWFLAVPEFQSKNGTALFLIEFSSVSVRYSIETLMEEIKPLNMKNEFEYRYEAMSKALIRFFVLSGFWCQDQNALFFIESSSASVKLSIETLIEKKKTLVTEKYEFDYQDESTVMALFAVFRPWEF